MKDAQQATINVPRALTMSLFARFIARGVFRCNAHKVSARRGRIECVAILAAVVRRVLNLKDIVAINCVGVEVDGIDVVFRGHDVTRASEFCELRKGCSVAFRLRFTLFDQGLDDPREKVLFQLEQKSLSPGQTASRVLLNLAHLNSEVVEIESDEMRQIHRLVLRSPDEVERGSSGVGQPTSASGGALLVHRWVNLLAEFLNPGLPRLYTR